MCGSATLNKTITVATVVCLIANYTPTVHMNSASICFLLILKIY